MTATELTGVPMENRLDQVSPLLQIESHAWDATTWPKSDRLLDQVEAEVALARGRLVYERYLRSGPGGTPPMGRTAFPRCPCSEPPPSCSTGPGMRPANARRSSGSARSSRR